MSFVTKYFRFLLLLIAIAAFIFLAHSGYCYYEDPNEDGYCAILMRGDFTGGPQVLPNSSGFWTGLTYLVEGLYRYKAGIDWYACFMATGYSLLLFQIAQILPFLYNTLKKLTGKWVAAFILCCCGILFVQNLFLWQLTRLSLLLSGLSLFKIWLNLKANESNPAFKWGGYIFNIFCFAYAACIRSEPAAVNLVIWIPLALLDYLNGYPLKKYTAFVPLLLATGIISIIINTPVNNADRNYMAFRKYQFSFFDYKQPLSTLSLSGPEDSMIYQAASTAFLSDSAKVNPAFFKRIGMMPMDKTVSAIPYYFRNLATGPQKIVRAWNKLTAGCPGFAFFYFLCMLTGLFFVYAVVRNRFLWYLLSQLYPVLLILAITSLMKMENRVLVPMMWCFLIQNLIWCSFLAGNNFSAKRTVTFSILVFLVLLFAVKIDTAKIYDQWKWKRYEEKQTDGLVEKINSCSEKIIVINDNACGKFCIRPFKTQYRFNHKQTICLNYFQLFWLNGYAQYMQSVCGKSDIPGIVETLYSRRNDVIFVSKIARMEFLKNYFRVLYHVELPYAPLTGSVPDENNSSVAKNNDVNLYRFI